MHKLVVRPLSLPSNTMHTYVRMPIRHAIYVLLLTSVSACGWVDSTGKQGSDVVSSGTIKLRNAQPVSILEQVSVIGTLEGEGATLQNWQWVSENTDARSRCASLSGFPTELSVTSLENACTQADSCSLSIEESHSSTGTEFKLLLPQLKVPVALSYKLTALQDDNATVTREQLLCGVSINEAPSAKNDSYIAYRNELRIVNAYESDNLLNNDSDDDDIHNKSLRVITTAVTAPRHAAQFSLDSQGGFVYQASDDALASNEPYIEDSFVYAITDGSHVVEATATIKIVNGNREPVRVQQVPDLTLTADNGLDESHIQQFDLSEYFSDPDSDTLTYYIDPNSLPDSANISLSSSGLLSTKPSNDDIGHWRVEVIVSDGLGYTGDIFDIRIAAASIPNPVNRSPSVTDIKNHTVSNQFEYDVSPFFTDKDNDSLKFTAIGLPLGISISKAGVISGTATWFNRGRWYVRVTASDGRGGYVDDGFKLTIR